MCANIVPDQRVDPRASARAAAVPDRAARGSLMEEQRARWLWYERTWLVIVALVVFWPIGLALMWVQGKFSPATRVAVSIAAPVLSAALLAGIEMREHARVPAVHVAVEILEAGRTRMRMAVGKRVADQFRTRQRDAAQDHGIEGQQFRREPGLL